MKIKLVRDVAGHVASVATDASVVSTIRRWADRARAKTIGARSAAVVRESAVRQLDIGLMEI